MVENIDTSMRAALSGARSSASPTSRAGVVAKSKSAAVTDAVLACRPLVDQDIVPAIALLSAGFPERTPAYWTRALRRLRDRSVPDEKSRYGYVMSDRGRLVGILLLILSKTDDGASRGNVSSWYVEPAYRGFANLLLAVPFRMPDVTLMNISPTPTTLDTIRAQGFSKYVGGTFQAIAALAPKVPGARVRQVKAGSTASPLLTDHANWNCLSFEVLHEGEIHPFVFVRSRFLGDKIPCAQLVYCRDVVDFVRYAGPLGRRLLRLGMATVMVDADAPLPGLTGSYRPGRGLRFFRGAVRPRIGDLSYTELAIFGP